MHLAQPLIRRARRLDAADRLAVDLDNAVYPLDSTTTDLCLSVFPWAHFRSTKAVLKLHTLLDLRGNIPSFIRVSDGELHDVNVLDLLVPVSNAFYVLDRGHIAHARLYVLNQAGSLLPHPGEVELGSGHPYSASTDRSIGVISDPTIALNRFYASKDYPERLRPIRRKVLETGKTLVFLTNNTVLPPPTIAALYKNRWQIELLFK